MRIWSKEILWREITILNIFFSFDIWLFAVPYCIFVITIFRYLVYIVIYSNTNRYLIGIEYPSFIKVFNSFYPSSMVFKQRCLMTSFIYISKTLNEPKIECMLILDLWCAMMTQKSRTITIINKYFIFFLVALIATYIIHLIVARK